MSSDVRRAWQRLRELVARNGTARDSRSLVGRLLAALVVTALLVYVAGIAGIWWAGGRLIQDSARKQAVQWLAELDELGTPLYVSSDRDGTMQALSRRLARFPEIVHVRYYAASGAELLGEYVKAEPHLFGGLGPEERTRAEESADGYRLVMLDGARLRVTAPVRVHALAPDAMFDLERAPARQTARTIGYLDFVFDAGAQQLVFERSLIGGSLALAFVLGVAVVFGRYRVRRAMAPLTALEEPLARLARGEIDVDLSGGGDREIVAIREALGATLAAIRQRDEALRRAECDPLTGLVNQRYFYRELALECGRGDRNGNAGAVLCIDLDGFRAVNERLGAAAGDRLLGQVAGLLRSRIRDNDMLARFEGDEFLALARGVNREGALKVARAINQVLQDYQFSDGELRLAISASIGIAMVERTGEPQRIVAQARSACAQAKARGGNRYVAYERGTSGEGAAAPREDDSPAWSRYVRTAIQDNALRFVYQPILDLRHADGEMYELLLRLAAPGGELVSPTAFLPVADRFGLIGELDDWVVRRACEELAVLHAQGRPATFFVNVSGHVFEQGEAFAGRVAEELARHELAGRHLVFEITEQAAVRDLQHARTTIEALARVGCRFALDDFGSGFSSLSYLKHLPVAFIKMSGAFAENLETETVDAVMVRSIVQIARALNMRTVAEAVEDEQTLRRLAELGVDYAQGYAVARPAESLLDPPPTASAPRVASRRQRLPTRAAPPRALHKR
ncbi:MAG TPA: EAL domain-containing protein [Burkholderiales bacterium]